MVDLPKGESVSDDELAPKEYEFDDKGNIVSRINKDTWATEVPKIPMKDVKKARLIIEDLQKQFSKRKLGSNKIAEFWDELQKRSEDAFHRLGIRAHVEVVMVARDMSGKQVQLRAATPENPQGFAIQDGEFFTPPYYNVEAISPVIVAEDWETLDTKKAKAEETIEEREKRRARGDGYFGE